MAPPYKILGSYKPVGKQPWSPLAIGTFLTNFTKGLGLKPHNDPAHGPLILTKAWYNIPLHAEVRTRTSLTAMSAEGWHYDGDDTPGADSNCCLVLWSSKTPTEFKFMHGDGTVYQPGPYEIVIAHNMHALHRRPAGCPRVRYIFRQRVAIPTHMELP